jgi:hypothetical protein
MTSGTVHDKETVSLRIYEDEASERIPEITEIDS